MVAELVRASVCSWSAAVKGRSVALTVKARDSVDLELWDLQHELELFREVFGKTLQVSLSGRR